MTENEKKMTAVVKPEDIESLIELFEASDWDEMHLEIEGLELFLSSDPKARIAAQPQHPTAAHASASAHDPAGHGPSRTSTDSGQGSVKRAGGMHRGEGAQSRYVLPRAEAGRGVLCR